MRGGGSYRGAYVALESNPYQPHKPIVAKFTFCETCDRQIETKDWNAHQAGKKHQKAAQELRLAEKEAEESQKDWGDQANDAAQDDNGWTNNDGEDYLKAALAGGKGANGTCYNCGETGHIKAECPEAPWSGGGQECYGCGQVGHRKSECPNGGGPRPCFNCGEVGHRKADCPNPSSAGGGGGRPCYNCGEVGHLKSECTNPMNPAASGGNDRPCFKCGQVGHMARDCNICANCGLEGHGFFQCDQKKDWSKITCSVCKEKGHTKKKCPKAQEPDYTGSGGGFGGGGAWDSAGGANGGSWGDAGINSGGGAAGGWDGAPAAGGDGWDASGAGAGAGANSSW